MCGGEPNYIQSKLRPRFDLLPNPQCTGPLWVVGPVEDDALSLDALDSMGKGPAIGHLLTGPSPRLGSKVEPWYPSMQGTLDPGCVYHKGS